VRAAWSGVTGRLAGGGGYELGRSAGRSASLRTWGFWSREGLVVRVEGGHVKKHCTLALALLCQQQLQLLGHTGINRSSRTGPCTHPAARHTLAMHQQLIQAPPGASAASPYRWATRLPCAAGLASRPFAGDGYRRTNFRGRLVARAAMPQADGPSPQYISGEAWRDRCPLGDPWRGPGRRLALALALALTLALAPHRPCAPCCSPAGGDGAVAAAAAAPALLGTRGDDPG
jgi:hypothetical protein